jgi:hypothetical protein
MWWGHIKYANFLPIVQSPYQLPWKLAHELLFWHVCTHTHTHTRGLNNIPKSMEQSLFWTIIIAQLIKKYLANYGILRSFFSVFTRTHHWSPSGTTRIQSTPSNPICWGSILVLFFHLLLGLLSYFFLWGFPTNILCAFSISQMTATCLYYVTLSIILYGEECRVWSLLYSILCPPVTSCALSSM